MSTGQVAAVQFGVSDGVGLLLLSRPEVRNSMSSQFLAEILDALRSSAMADCRAMVVAGDGGAFCAGADLSVVQQAFAGDTDTILGDMLLMLHQIIRRLRALPVPTIAAVEGPAVGAGMGLALATDVRVIGPSACFIPGYMAVGASPDAGVSYFLTRALGSFRARSALLLNRPLHAPQLLQWGLADELVEEGQAVAVATQWADRLATIPTESLLAVRRLVDLAPTHDLDRHLDEEARYFQACWKQGNFEEGVNAFLEGRAPRFS